MKSILFLALASYQTLMAGTSNQDSPYQGAQYGYQPPHSKAIENPMDRKKKISSRVWKIIAASAGTFCISAFYVTVAQGSGITHVIPFAASSAVGVSLYYFTSEDELEE